MNRSRLIVSKSLRQIAVGKRAFTQIQKYNYLLCNRALYFAREHFAGMLNISTWQNKKKEANLA